MFSDWRAVDTAQSAASIFDITHDQEPTLENYCIALLEKVFTIPQSQLPEFITYQIQLNSDGTTWLNKFEKLLANNEELFISQKALSRFNKLYNIIEKKRTELQASSVKEIKQPTPKRLINADAEDRYFSFFEVKQHVEKMESFNDKILYLNEEIFEYRQADIISINNKLQPYDKQCVQLIEKLQTLRKMRSEIEKEKELEQNNKQTIKKLKFNGNLNQLVDIFYQLSRELFVDGKSFIDASNGDIVNMIVNNFIDKDNNEISPQTVETILKPSRGDKRPKTHKRIDLDNFL
ncbi:MAG: hypothetical protein L6Q46_08790 [Flavobacterium sp.]|nr:hypothetical protein [Flavobacterium sp.]